MKVKTSDLINDALDLAAAKAESLVFAPVSGAGSIWFKFGVWTKPGPGGEQRPYVLLSEYKNWTRQCDGYVLRRGTSIWSPSTNWSQGGPIIEREHIATMSVETAPFEGEWSAEVHRHQQCTSIDDEGGRGYSFYQSSGITGPTLLVAAMRCFVASRLGDEVEVPEELLT